MLLKLILLAASLGVDNLSVGVSIGLGQLKLWRLFLVAVLFGVIQTIMPAVGIVGGQLLAGPLGHVAAFLGYAILMAVGVATVRSGMGGNGHADHRGVMEGPWAILLTGVAVGLDSLAVGFSLGFGRTSLTLALILFGISAFMASFLGMVLGGRVGSRFGPVAEVIAGCVLGLTGVGLLIERLVEMNVV